MEPELVSLFENQKWRPYNLNERNEVLKNIIPMVLPSTRISRISRKCSDDEVEGTKVRTDRGIVEKKFGCRCIRCREPLPREEFDLSELEIKRDCWSDNEIYFEASIMDRCIGVLRMHLDNQKAIVRELHIYGIESKPGEKGIHQHKGVGKKLLNEAEIFAKQNNCKLIDVASGIGVREYYIKRGYSLINSGFVRKIIQP